MTGFSFAPSIPKWVGFFLFLFAITLQAQITFGETEFSLGLRLSSSDFLLPFVGIIIAGLILTGRATWPQWALARTDIWMGALTLLIITSFVWGYFYTGELSTWALYNRLVGWFVLLACFYAGAWFASQYGHDFIAPFLKFFCGFCFAAGILCLGILMLGDVGIEIQVPFITQGQLCGFLVNRNAYALSFATGFIILCFYALKNKLIFPVFVTNALIFLTPFMLVYNGSRALWGVFFTALLVLAIYNHREAFRNILPPFCLGVVFLLTFCHFTGTSTFRENQMGRFNQTIEAVAFAEVEKGMHPSEGVRAFVLRDALGFWQDSPVMGVGLGGYLFLQKRLHGVLIDVIDNTPLWVMTETGLIGLFVFGAFAIRVVCYLISHIRQQPEIQSNFLWVILLILGAFAMMSLVHQLLYTRFLWFFLGLALAKPAKTTIFMK